MPLKLFAIKNLDTDQVLPNLFFESQKLARDKRNNLNATVPGTWVVTYGPEHKKYNPTTKES